MTKLKPSGRAYEHVAPKKRRMLTIMCPRAAKSRRAELRLNFQTNYAFPQSSQDLQPEKLTAEARLKREFCRVIGFANRKAVWHFSGFQRSSVYAMLVADSVGRGAEQQREPFTRKEQTGAQKKGSDRLMICTISR